MKNIIFSLILFSSLTLSACTFQPKSQISPPPTPVSTASPEPLLGGDADPHGCIGSAGYSWCESKSKCLRIWEESCDETELIKTAVKQALIAKHGASAGKLNITVSRVENYYYSSGGASGEGGGGMWFAAKVDGQWKLVWDGNGSILCSDLLSYPEFPSSLISECYDQKTNKTVIR